MIKKLFRFALFSYFILNGLSLYSKDKPGREVLYIGTFSQRGSKGIYVYQFDRSTKKLQLQQTVSGMISPSFLTISSDNDYLYSVDRGSINQKKDWGSVSAYDIDSKTGDLKLIDHQPSYGSEPCNISLDYEDHYAFVSNYEGGNMAILPVEKDGGLGPAVDTIQYTGSSINGNRQTRPHIHSAVLSADNKFLYVTDLGTDKIMIYKIKENGLPEPADMPWIKVSPGAGPRHLAFSPSGKFVYLTEELSSKISAFKRNKKTGALELIQHVSSLPADFNGINALADLHVHPSGKFLYASNRGHNSIVIFAIDKKGMLQYVGHQSTEGKKPRNFIIDHSGEFLFVANRESDNVVLFEIDRKTGKLTYTGTQINVPAPVCLKMVKLH